MSRKSLLLVAGLIIVAVGAALTLGATAQSITIYEGCLACDKLGGFGIFGSSNKICKSVLDGEGSTKCSESVSGGSSTCTTSGYWCEGILVTAPDPGPGGGGAGGWWSGGGACTIYSWQGCPLTCNTCSVSLY